MDPRLSSPGVVKMMMRRHEVFDARRKLAHDVCQNISIESPLHRPRDGTIYFDILWDPHYQVRLKLSIGNLIGRANRACARQTDLPISTMSAKIWLGFVAD